ncbi:MAG: peptidoglycan editing factor PgeF [Bryobacteraceae bacterium]|nr:peptidoglycan editing factor PgeF [Bryobacteraceae bacterium]
MFERGQDSVYRSSLLQSEHWLDHGFASRNAPDWPGSYFQLRQIHSSTVVPSSWLDEESPSADGVVSNDEGLWLGIRTADCVPMLLADPVHRCVAAIHAGWKGTSAGIAMNGVHEMSTRWHSRPEDLVVAIGPSIGQCCFEVGSEVEQLFERQFPEATGRGKVDLAEANRRQLMSCGVLANRIDVAVECTKCMGDQFHSWRRDAGTSGRMVSAIRIR